MINIQLFQFLNSLASRSSWLDTLIIFFATSFSIILIVITIVYIFKNSSNDSFFRKILIIFGSAILTYCLVKIIKNLVFTPRPFLSLDSVNLLFKYGDYDSFPSGHTAIFSSLAMAIYFYNKKASILFFFGALIIGVARVIAGIHFPIDILSGLGLGIVISSIVYFFTSKR